MQTIQKQTRPQVERISLRPSEVGDALGICRSKAYGLIRAGKIPSVMIGSSRRVPVNLLAKWIAEQAQP